MVKDILYSILHMHTVVYSSSNVHIVLYSISHVHTCSCLEHAYTYAEENCLSQPTSLLLFQKTEASGRARGDIDSHPPLNTLWRNLCLNLEESDIKVTCHNLKISSWNSIWHKLCLNTLSRYRDKSQVSLLEIGLKLYSNTINTSQSCDFCLITRLRTEQNVSVTWNISQLSGLNETEPVNC